MVIHEEFAAINNFTPGNSIIYADNSQYATAMQSAIRMSPENYGSVQAELARTADEIYAQSLSNLKRLLQKRGIAIPAADGAD